MDTMTDFFDTVTGHLRRLKKKILRTDRYVLACLVTGAVFLLLGLIQIIVIVAVRAQISFDTVILILVDFAVAGACVLLAMKRDQKVKRLRRASAAADVPRPVITNPQTTMRSKSHWQLHRN